MSSKGRKNQCQTGIIFTAKPLPMSEDINNSLLVFYFWHAILGKTKMGISSMLN
jgi:hypothetical protein